MNKKITKISCVNDLIFKYCFESIKSLTNGYTNQPLCSNISIYFCKHAKASLFILNHSHLKQLLA